MTNVNRTALFVGVSLAAASFVMLAGLAEGAARDAVGQAVRLWPLAIIALGAALLVRRTPYALVGTLTAATLLGLVVGGAVVAAPDVHGYCTDGDASTAPVRTGSFTGHATVDLSLDCGDLHVLTTAGTAWELRARAGSNDAAAVEASGESLVVRSATRHWYRDVDHAGDDWQVAIPTGVTVDVDAEVNAGRGRFVRCSAMPAFVRPSAMAVRTSRSLESGPATGHPPGARP